MAQTKLITELVSLVTPSDNDVFVIVDNTTSPSLSFTKKISYANLKEALEDAIGTFISGSTGINAVYDDPSNTFTISIVDDSSVQKVTISSGGTNVGSRKEVNFIAGSEITLSGVDNSGSNRIDLTVNSTAVSSGSNVTVSGTSYGVFSGVTTLGDNTKSLEFRPIKAASSKAVVAYADGGGSISVDVDPSQIAITSLDSSSPLDIPRGGTGSSTASGALANLGAAKAGINSDITALSGLTTPLSIAQGGTGAATSSGALQNLEGLKQVVDGGTIGESIVITGSTLVGGAFRSELRGIKGNSNKALVTTSGNDIAIDVDSDAVLAGATVNVPFNGVRLTNVGAPLNNSDAATKEYVDSYAKGLIAKEAVFLATTTGLTSTYSASGLTLTITGTGVPSIDGVNVTATGTRVLVKDQDSASENGIYYLATAAASGVSAEFARTEDYNADIEVQEGTFCYVISGTTNGGKQFIQTTKDPGLDSNDLVFVQFGGSEIGNDAIDNAKLANMDALTFKGAVVSGDPVDLTADQAIAIINSGGTTTIDSARVNVDLSSYATLSGAAFTGTVSISGLLGVGGANYGTEGQVLMSRGSGTSPTWESALPPAVWGWNDSLFSVADTEFYGSYLLGTDIRIGDVTGEADIDVQSRIRRCVINDSGVVQYYLDADDSTLKSGDWLRIVETQTISTPINGTHTESTNSLLRQNVPSWVSREWGLGDRVIYNGSLWECVVATTTATPAAGTVASDLTGTDGQVMVEVPAFSVRYGYLNNIHTREIRLGCGDDLAALGFRPHPAFVKVDGTYKDKFYIGAYQITGTSPATTVAGVNQRVSVTRATHRASAAARGTGWHIMSYYEYAAIQTLAVTEFRNMDSQRVIGAGSMKGNVYTVNTGLSNGDGNKCGNFHTPTVGSNSDYVSYRGLENIYGRCFQFVGGLNCYTQFAYLTNDQTAFADDTANGYTAYVQIVASPYSYQHTMNMYPLFDVFLAKSYAQGVPPNTGTDDGVRYFTSQVAWQAPIVGGDSWYDDDAGLFCMYFVKSNNIYNWCTARLSYAVN